MNVSPCLCVSSLSRPPSLTSLLPDWADLLAETGHAESASAARELAKKATAKAPSSSTAKPKATARKRKVDALAAGYDAADSSEGSVRRSSRRSQPMRAVNSQTEQERADIEKVSHLASWRGLREGIKATHRCAFFLCPNRETRRKRRRGEPKRTAPSMRIAKSKQTKEARATRSVKLPSTTSSAASPCTTRLNTLPPAAANGNGARNRLSGPRNSSTLPKISNCARESRRARSFQGQFGATTG